MGYSDSLTERDKARFWSKVVMAGADDCWEWSGLKAVDGYGHFYAQYRNSHMPHRVAYELKREAIPVGMTIDHLCRNRCCCNPAHMEIVTVQENIRRRVPSKPGEARYSNRQRLGRTAKRRARGLCSHCGTPSERSACDRCRDRMNERSRERTMERRRLGLSNKPGEHNRSKTHCFKGHIFDASNTHMWNGSRQCKECRRIRLRAYRAAKRAAANQVGASNT